MIRLAKSALFIAVLVAAAPGFGEVLPSSDLGDGTFSNPVIVADVPDPSVIRVGDAYYMASTTMHMTPGIPIMKSHDLVNWEIVNYCYDQLEDTDAYALKNGRTDYAKGSWAANIRYDHYQKRFYVIIACNSSRKSYFFSTDKIEGGAWHRSVVPICYDPGLLFEDTGKEMKRYVIYGQGKHNYREMFVDDKFNVTLGEEKPFKEVCNIENPPRGLKAEGNHGYKFGEYYYIFMIQGVGAQRQQIVWRGKSLEKPDEWEVRLIMAGNVKDRNGRDAMGNTGAAQGGVFDTPDGKWYSMLFQDFGAVGRIPVLIPLVWKDGWPVLGNEGKSVDQILPVPVKTERKLSQGIVRSDEFDNRAARHVFSDLRVDTSVTAGLSIEQINALVKQNLSTEDHNAKIHANEYGYNGSNLDLVWQWNHNPNNNLWSLTDRPGFFRLKSGTISNSLLNARNNLTQRTFGPMCSGTIAMEVGNMKDGDWAGLNAFQTTWGIVGVRMAEGKRELVMHRAQRRNDRAGTTIEAVPLTGSRVYLKIDFDFRNKTDKANFYYSLDGTDFKRIGDTLQMSYDLAQFVGYRFGLVYYSTQNLGGHVDFDYFRVSDKITNPG